MTILGRRFTAALVAFATGLALVLVLGSPSSADLTPETTIDSGPSGLTNSADASFTFSSSDPTATFECQLDGGGWAGCTSPEGYTGLSEGAHNFQVRATDLLLGTDPTPAEANWTVDTIAPDTSIDSGPPDPSGSDSATFTFSSNEAGSTFECKLDGGGWNGCSSPKTYNSLADGSHTFHVRATDPAGNTGSETTQTWTVDATAPDTTIDSPPIGLTSSQSATFSFSSSKAGSTFECKLDAGSFEACGSPKGYSGLGDGSHTFTVRATDTLGTTDATPASETWTVDTTPPNTTITSPPIGTTSSTSASFSFSSSESGSSFECKLDSGSWASCSSPKSYSSLGDGSHTFSVRATDQAGNTDPSGDSQTWTVDAAEPETTIDSPPIDLTNSTSATFSFSSSKAGSTFECKLDAAAFTACSSPKSYSGLGDGSHTFGVRATDTLGNTDSTPASETWTVDTTPPNTAITSGPSGVTGSNSASFGFSSTEGGSSFECKLDSGAFELCSSPKSYSGLADGSHTFSVRATDPAGNTDSSPDTQSWTIVTTTPDTSIDSGPSGLTGDNTPSFTFSSPEPGATFECRLDGPGATTGSFSSCSSPKTYKSLADGSYTFLVRAKNAVSSDPSPASSSFTVDTTPPNTTITSGPSGVTSSSSASFGFSSTEGGSSFECKLDSGAFELCSSPKSYSGLPDGSHTFSVRATDPAGNTDSSPDTQSWKVVTTTPDTSIDSGPSGLTGDSTPSFTFSSSEPTATFECRLDGPGTATGSFSSCSSPKTYNSLADGSYTFFVRAKNAISTDPTPASRSFTVDTTAPNTVINSGPQGLTSSDSATFDFSSTEGGSTFECQLQPDQADFQSCNAPAIYMGLSDGTHKFLVRAIDQLGHVDATPASRSFTVDTTPPQTTITSGPTGTTSDDTPTFEFSSSSPDAAGFECRLDSNPFTACSSPYTAAPLTNGSHTFEVAARDAAGNVDPSPASRAFTVDTGLPNTIIDSGPTGSTTNTAPSFSFHADKPGSTFECQLTGPGQTGGFTACISPQGYGPLGDGAYTFSVRASSVAGTDPTPATRSFAVDNTAPQTTITSGPVAGSTTNLNSATFAFTSNEAGVSFQCKLDGAAFTLCSSPASYTALADGPHTFRVRAVDQAGNLDPSEASRSWTIDTIPPDTLINSGPSGITNSSSVSFTFASTENSSTFECMLDSGGWQGCTSAKSYSGLAQGLHNFSVRATDTAKNVDATPATSSFTVDTVAPTATITSGPVDGSTTSSPSVTFEFSSNEPNSTFKCKLDSDDYASCTSPVTYNLLTDVKHTFKVIAIDEALNSQQIATTRSWTVKTGAPDTFIDSGPTGSTNNASPSFTFSSNEPGVSYQCSLDNPDPAAFGSCTSPTSYGPLPDGSLTFFVRAIDVVGNPDATPAKRSFTIDTTPPDTAIKSGPPDTGTSTSATFDFSSTEAGSSFQCRIDGGGFGGCSPTKVYADLPAGKHGFEVRAIDQAGNADPTPASRGWTIFAARAFTGPTGPQLISPFPVVRIAGTILRSGVRLRLLAVSTPVGSKVVVKCKGKRCPFARRSRTAALGIAKRLARAARVIHLRTLEKHFYPAGVKLEVFVTKFGFIGKYTKFTIRRNRAPARLDRCLMPGLRKPVRCPRS